MELKYLQEMIQSLPTSIEMEGFGILRAVTINGEYLKVEDSTAIVEFTKEGFNWGYVGSGGKQLALGILVKLLQPKDLTLGELGCYMGLASSLADKFIAAIPYNNFQATLGIKEVCQNMLDDMPFDISNCCNIAEVVLDEVEVAAAKAPEVKQEGGSND